MGLPVLVSALLSFKEIGCTQVQVVHAPKTVVKKTISKYTATTAAHRPSFAPDYQLNAPRSVSSKVEVPVKRPTVSQGGSPPRKKVNVDGMLYILEKEIIMGKNKDSVKQPTPAQSQLKVHRSGTKKAETQKPYDKPEKNMDKQGKSMMSPGSSNEAAQQQQRKMIPVKNVEITAESYESMIRDSQKQQQIIEELMSTIRQQTERIENLEKLQNKGDSIMQTDRIQDDKPQGGQEQRKTGFSHNRENTQAERRAVKNLLKTSSSVTDIEGNKPGTSQQGSNHYVDAETTPPTKNKGRPPPIVIFGQDQAATVSLIKGQLEKENFHVKRVNKNKHTLYTENIQDFKHVKEQLEATEAKFFSYTPKEEKVQSFLLKGLDTNVDPEELIIDLKTLNVENVTFLKASRYTTPKSLKENKFLPFYLVQISPSSQSTKLHSIKYINHQVVRWEKLKKRGSIQCKKCQRLGHVASNCRLDYRCVKCSENHQPGECKVPKPVDVSDRSQLFCVTCKKFGHPASYRGCEVHLQLKRRALEKIQSLKESRITKERMINNYVKSGISYSNITKNNTQKNTEITQKLTQQNTTCTQNSQDNPCNPNTLETITKELLKITQLVKQNSERINNLYLLLTDSICND